MTEMQNMNMHNFQPTSDIDPNSGFHAFIELSKKQTNKQQQKTTTKTPDRDKCPSPSTMRLSECRDLERVLQKVTIPSLDGFYPPI